jgi:hypothetical protein
VSRCFKTGKNLSFYFCTLKGFFTTFFPVITSSYFAVILQKQLEIINEEPKELLTPLLQHGCKYCEDFRNHWVPAGRPRFDTRQGGKKNYSMTHTQSYLHALQDISLMVKRPMHKTNHKYLQFPHFIENYIITLTTVNLPFLTELEVSLSCSQAHQTAAIETISHPVSFKIHFINIRLSTMGFPSK